MSKRILALFGAVILSLMALSSLVRLMSSSVSVARADPVCQQITSDIMTDTTWTGECYRVMTMTVIQRDAALTISPPVTGTRVEFMAGSQLQAFGYLYALGTSSRPITFTSASAAPGRDAWLGIELEAESGGDVIRYSVVEYARTGIRINNVKDLQIMSNTFRYNGDGASLDGAISGITDRSNISYNRIYSNSNGIVLGKSYSNTLAANLIYNIIRYGLAFTEQPGIPGGDDNQVIGNEIHACAVGLQLENGSDNKVFENMFYLNPDGAIYLSGQRSASVRYNHVYSNGDEGGSGYQAAIYMTGTPDLAPDVAYNTIYDEHNDAIEYAAHNGNWGPWMTHNALCSTSAFAYELHNAAGVTVNITGTWWGTNTPTAGHEYTGPVSLNPWITLTLGTLAANLPADGASSTVVTITLRDSDGFTVPPPPTRQTNPPAPNPRRIELTTTLGALSPMLVSVDDHGIATTTLTSASTPGTATLTATAFCGFAYTTTVKMIGTDLAVTKSDSPDPVTAGKTLTYTLAFTNAGPSDAQNVFITDTLPVSVVYRGVVSETPPIAGPTQTGRLLTWYTPTLAVGASGRIVFTVTVNADAIGPMVNSAVITSSTPDPAPGNNRADEPTIVDTGFDLVVVKNDNVGPLSLNQQQALEQIQRVYGVSRLYPLRADREFVRPGERITYTILYVNSSENTARNIVLTETLLAHTQYMGGGWTPAGGNLYTVTLGDLPAHHGGALQFVVQVNPSLPCGTDWIVNQVRIGGSDPEYNLSNNWSTDETPVLPCPMTRVFLPIILKNYSPPQVQVAFSNSNYAVWESKGVATITVMLIGTSEQTVTVDYATGDGTATAGSDYMTRSGTLTFTSGATERTFTVTILNDAVYEPNETVTLTLTNAVSAQLGTPNRATLTILDVGCRPTPPGCAPDLWCTFASDSSPMGMAYDSSRDYLFVANRSSESGSGNLAVISGTSGVPIRVVPGLPDAHGVALDKTLGRNRIYVVGGNSLYVVDGVTYNTAVPPIRVGVGEDTGAYAVAHNPANDLIYVTGFRDDSVTIVDAATLHVVRTMTGFQSPSFIAVNTDTHKVYVSNHTGGPVSWVSVISGTTKIGNVYLSGDVYGIAADSVHNRVYVASISAARVYALDGTTDKWIGDIQIIRSKDGRPVPLRMVAVNPSAGSDTHLWLTSSHGDFWGMDRLILLSGNWPTMGQPRALEVMPSPESGLVFDPGSWKVFASSAASNGVTVSKDSIQLCPMPLGTGADAEHLYTVVHEYNKP